VDIFPHERSLVQALEGLPFVLLGVNSDDDPKLKEKNQEQQINWRSFKDSCGDNPSITNEWNLEGWPTLYLIDHKGIIRKKWLGGADEITLQKEVIELVRAAEGRQKE
jgi:hypothetical protein